jgi:hypothetical protein
MEPSHENRRVRLDDGGATTVHILAYPLASTEVRVVRLEPEAPLEEWCDHHGIPEAVSGGYAVKPEYEPLGELWLSGRRQPYRDFAPPWSSRRAALLSDEDGIRVDHRDRPPSSLTAIYYRPDRCWFATVAAPSPASRIRKASRPRRTSSTRI